MKTFGVMVGVGIGYLAGNEEVRRKVFDLVEQVRTAPQTRELEDLVSRQTGHLINRGQEFVKRSDDASKDTASNGSSSKSTASSGGRSKSTTGKKAS